MENDYWLAHLDSEIKVSLISFFYNLWYRSRVIEIAKTNDKYLIEKEIKQYVKAGWRTLWGLVKRRNQEVDFFKNYKTYSIKYK